MQRYRESKFRLTYILSLWSWGSLYPRTRVLLLPMISTTARQHVLVWPLHPRLICLQLAEIGPVVQGKNILKFRQYIFSISCFSPLEKRASPFTWTNLNNLHLRMLFAKLTKLGWNWRSCSKKEDFQIVDASSLPCYCFPFDNPLYLKMPSAKFIYIIVLNYSWVLEKKTLKFLHCTCISAFSLL